MKIAHVILRRESLTVPISSLERHTSLVLALLFMLAPAVALSIREMLIFMNSFFESNNEPYVQRFENLKD